MPYRKRLGHLATLLACFSVFSATAFALDDQRPLQGRSADLGFTFRTLQTPWCGKHVVVELTAPNAAVYERDRRGFERALGRLRAAVLAPSECSRAQSIVVIATVEGSVVQRMSMTAFSRWVIVQEDPQTLEPSCFDTADRAACASHAAAYTLLRDLALTEVVPPFQLARFLNAAATPQAEWTAKGLKGQLVVLPRQSFPAEANAPLMAEAVMADAEEECREGWRIHARANSSGRVIQRAFACDKGTFQHEEVIVMERGPSFFVFSLRATGRDPTPLRIFAGQLAAALTRQAGDGPFSARDAETR